MGLIKLKNTKGCNQVTDLFNYSKEQSEEFTEQLIEKVKTLLEKIDNDDIKDNIESMTYINDNFTQEEVLFLANIHVCEQYARKSNPILMSLQSSKK